MAWSFGIAAIAAIVAIVALGVVVPSAAAAPPPSGFDAGPLKRPDFATYCRQHHGSGSQVGGQYGGIDSLACTDGSATVPVDAQQACLEQLGSNDLAVAVGATADDWRCLDWGDAAFYATPVVLVAKDLAHDPALSQGLANSERVISTVRDWYQGQLDRKLAFRILQPLVVNSQHTVAEWNRLSCLTADPPRDLLPLCKDVTGPVQRLILWQTAHDEVAAALQFAGRVAMPAIPVFIFAGADSAYGSGAAGIGGVNVNPPSTAACKDTEPYCGTYSVAHELGHNFGMGHTCDLRPQPANCQGSIMQSGQLPAAELVDVEEALLRGSPFFGPFPACAPGSTSLCLNGARFRVQASWHDSQGGSGLANAVMLTADTGYFWFFSDHNIELMVKVLDGCSVSHSFWVFAAGLTNVQVDLEVTDMLTGKVRTYSNAQGRAFSPLQDTGAFAACPGSIPASGAAAPPPAEALRL
ncbi:MAG: zinc-dependent metalloprotease, partial [Acidobacteriota bacterium]|nr:zinc-dependent metalloprotease [Acidobacteriota bacterium]